MRHDENVNTFIDGLDEGAESIAAQKACRSSVPAERLGPHSGDAGERIGFVVQLVPPCAQRRTELGAFTY